MKTRMDGKRVFILFPQSKYVGPRTTYLNIHSCEENRCFSNKYSDGKPNPHDISTESDNFEHHSDTVLCSALLHSGLSALIRFTERHITPPRGAVVRRPCSRKAKILPAPARVRPLFSPLLTSLERGIHKHQASDDSMNRHTSRHQRSFRRCYKPEQDRIGCQ